MLLLNLIMAVVLENSLYMVQNDTENKAKQMKKRDTSMRAQLADIWHMITDGASTTTIPALEK